MGRQILLSLFSGKAQLIAVFPEYVIVVPGGAASVVTAGVFTGGGGASPRQVVVMALSGWAQLITPLIVNGTPGADSPADDEGAGGGGAGAGGGGAGGASPRHVVVIALSG